MARWARISPTAAPGRRVSILDSGSWSRSVRRSCRPRVVANAQLHPHDLRPDRYSLIDNRHDPIRAAKNIDHIDGLIQYGEYKLARESGIDRNDPLAPPLTPANAIQNRAKPPGKCDVSLDCGAGIDKISV